MVDPAVSIRVARPDDAEGLTILHNLPNFRFGTMRMPFETVESVRQRVFGGGADDLHLVAERDRRIVGSASLRRGRSRRSHVGSIGMGVHDDFRGRGIGRALLLALLDVADNWMGLVRVELVVNIDNAAAIGLYRSAGFEVEGTARLAVLRAGAYVDCLAMSRTREAPRPLAGHL